MAEEETDLKLNFHRQCLNVSNSLKNLTNFENDKTVTEKVPMPRPPPVSPKIRDDCDCNREEPAGGMTFSTPLRYGVKLLFPSYFLLTHTVSVGVSDRFNRVRFCLLALKLLGKCFK